MMMLVLSKVDKMVGLEKALVGILMQMRVGRL